MSTSQRYDFILVGGGLVGACLAEELAVGGASVLVADAGPEPGHATARAAGIAVPSLRYAGGEFYQWLVGARQALRDDIARLEPRHGPFSLARPVVRLLGEADLQAVPHGADHPAAGRPLAGTELASLAPGARLPVGRRPFLAEDGLLVNGKAYLHAVREAAIAAGTRWRQGATVHAAEDDGQGMLIRYTDGTTANADRVVLTAGAWTGLLAPQLPVTPQRGQLAVLSSAAGLDCILSGRLYLSPLPGGGLVAGATEENAGFSDHCTAGSVAGLLAYAVAAIPALAAAEVTELRSGLRPVSGTGFPLAGRVPGRRRLFTAAGHAGHGLMSGRLTARGLAAGLLRSDWDQLPEQFCPAEAATAAAAVAAGGDGPCVSTM
jgi:glycine oxidase